MKVVVAGSGIVGLCCAYYLQKSGYEVTVTDKGDGLQGCSYGNAGYVSPSHFIPLASPGIVAQGLRWMTSASSPFYIKPRINMDLIKWGLKFYMSATENVVKRSIPPLNALLHYSREMTIGMANELNNTFDLQLRGCYMLCRLPKTMDHEIELAHEAKSLGIETITYTHKELQALEPNVGIEAVGAVMYPIDAHLDPNKWMQAMYQYLTSKNVAFINHAGLVKIEKHKGKVKQVILENGTSLSCDHLVVATGSWLPEVMKKLGLKILLQPGKGYSTTYEGLKNNLSKPAILVDDRVAMTPWNDRLRIGGTMELSGINHDINLTRVEAIVKAANRHCTALNLEMPSKEKIWCGLRPVSPDGMPYIGRVKQLENVTVAGGHAMLGISLAAGTGKLIDDLVGNRKPQLEIESFDPCRF